MPDAALQQRIKSKCQVAANGCWLWTAGARGVGYGAIKVAGKVMDAHRASYQAFIGQIPTGMLVMHACDDRRCVNPQHLQLGTYKANHSDAVQKGRTVPFRTLRTVPLTDEQLAAIFDEYDRGVSERQLCLKHSIPPTTLKRLLRRRATPSTA
jgi:hypothetical protein